ncbi:MAG: hypothetical protein ACXVCO_20380 [Ktedonobacterales bacterium]
MRNMPPAGSAGYDEPKWPDAITRRHLPGPNRRRRLNAPGSPSRLCTIRRLTCGQRKEPDHQ